ncbi:Protein of unknown function DUF2650 family-containing protein [Strongyloides ratti]|uniref:Uncharacterized protein n=1 Tax=Strongyloides ratti TaxID=34506 RepID=A0A090MX83_STRRB|nr:Protein of unknown function DUF2650 family-containing protein [Strongyloides ratti]CEF64984.1 Protein of unknown function DUF2650 family-containing protein [Strongyloides ratti]
MVQSLYIIFIILILIKYIKCVYQCPLAGSGGGNLYGGNYCGAESLFHHYSCCEDNYFECCFELEDWVKVLFAVIGILLLFCCFGTLLSFYWAYSRVTKASRNDKR